MKELMRAAIVGAVAGVMIAGMCFIVKTAKDNMAAVEEIAIESANLQVKQERDIEEDIMRQHVEENNERYAAELDMLARCVEAEAGNQSLDVKRAVIAVIMNRVDDDDWPDTISGVITDPYEFATYWNGKMDEVTPSDETYQAIRMEMQTRSYPGLYYFDMDRYLLYGTPYAKMGDLYFSTK